MKTLALLLLLSVPAFSATPVHYGGAKHTTSHGGHYTRSGSNHKGGHYTSPTGNHKYGKHK